MKTAILWTLWFTGPQPYIVDRNLTHTECRQAINDSKPPIASGSYKQRSRKATLVCKPQV